MSAELCLILIAIPFAIYFFVKTYFEMYESISELIDSYERLVTSEVRLARTLEMSPEFSRYAGLILLSEDTLKRCREHVTQLYIMRQYMQDMTPLGVMFLGFNPMYYIMCRRCLHDK